MTKPRVPALGVVVALLVAGSAHAQTLQPSAVVQIGALLDAKRAQTTMEQKLDTALWIELLRRRSHPLLSRIPALRTGPKLDDQDRVWVDLSADPTPALLREMRALGCEIWSVHAQRRRLRARMPFDALEALMASTDVSRIHSAAPVTTSAIDVSEGDVAHRADQARAQLGVDGSGAMICVLSDSVDALGSLVASGDLPPGVMVLPGQSGNPGSSEGTAMLEIVHDLAPGADLGFATAFGGEDRFADNILALRAAGCDVLVDDVIYLTEPVFQDGVIAQAVDTVVADGAAYFSSAGNFGNLDDGRSGVFEGDFLAGPAVLGGDTALFTSAANVNRVTVDPGLAFTLKWADGIGGSVNDYDLFLVDPTLSFVEDASIAIQDGNDDPLELISSDPWNDTNSGLVVVRTTGQPVYFQLNTNGGRLDIGTDGQTYGHSAAAGAVSVAAVDVALAGGGAFVDASALAVEPFSSDGPRRVFFAADGTPLTPGDFTSTGGLLRQKPDLTAADGVSTATPGFSRFFGTSAAAPHAAAIAGLALSLSPQVDASQVRSALEQTARDIESPGTDRSSGAGVVDAVAVLSALTSPVPSTALGRTALLAALAFAGWIAAARGRRTRGQPR